MFRSAVRTTLTIGLASLCLIGCDKRLEQAQETAEEGPPTREGACDAACGELNFSCCDQRTDCKALRGNHLEADMACKVQNAFAGCKPADTQCNQSITHAVSPQGECWKLLNSCMPTDEWTVVEGEEKASCEEKLASAETC